MLWWKLRASKQARLSRIGLTVFVEPRTNQGVLLKRRPTRRQGLTMPSFSCPDPWWKDGHISPCIRDNYFAFYFSLTAALFSISFLCFAKHNHRRLSRRAHSLAQQDSDDNTASLRDAGARSQPFRTGSLARRMQLIETVVLAVDIVIVITTIPLAGLLGLGSESLFLAVYLFFLSLTRRYRRALASSARLHLQCLYCVQWICIFMVARDILMVSAHGRTRLVTFLRLGLYTVLLLIQWTTPRALPIPQNDSEASIPRPEETASTLSWLFFAWVEGLVWKAFRTGTLQSMDMFPLNQAFSAEKVNTRLKNGEPVLRRSLLRLIFRVVSVDVLRQGAWAAMTSVLVFVPAFLIKLILEFLEQPDDMANSSNAWIYVFGLLISSLVAGIADCHCSCKSCFLIDDTPEPLKDTPLASFPPGTRCSR